ncbi:alpha-amylase family glycosyl hydrolase [bacterium]|nr:alpha-amylase family glycosyl hydrolase [bacterium]
MSRAAREKHKFEETLFSSRGHVIFANFAAARRFAQTLNEKRNVHAHPERAVKAGQINAMGLIDEVLHYVIELYREQANPRLFEDALHWLEEMVGKQDVDKTLVRFVEEFPPFALYRGNMDAQDYLAATTDGVPNREIAVEELLMLWLSNMNPAFSPALELFDDQLLEQVTAYDGILKSLGQFFSTQPRFGPDNQTLIELLRAPSLQHPDSLEAQLQFMRDHWGLLLQEFLSRLLRSLDLIREEDKTFFLGEPLMEVPDYWGMDDEPERFSPDREWMPRLVLMAKSTLVWLDQLSKKYQHHIYRLDQIPDEELDGLANWGFTGLWLIGIWQRSEASQSIKRMCGNPEAESSAYSLFDYEVSQDLGGYESLQNLKDRCWQRGIRLACDMVPNHTGLDSKWIREHPDWFISLPYQPFPSYAFNGPNFSRDPRFGIFIEDKYFDRSDASVVFKREDYWIGDVRFIYHGNDGTSMPWNDTAQLNFLNPEVREAVIQNIVRVARMFSVIRFDAAMTLSKKHYQRLWFPEPGAGGDIPSRSEHGLTRSQFNSAMPNEFWREVVDRIAAEVPDTLLLAEAFWLMEGYFVRTLGMHRVYNSAFMNMLKSEENQKYRDTIKNTIQFNPEILKRYVNFMNNPDEETAVAQFGKGDKYFGVCVMMVTMPGLPMFGHGQVEGFSEKYGMEYRRAYWDEDVDWGLLQHHERVIFPLMKRRYLFAEVENFLLYDFFAPEGHVNENVFAYSNRHGEERALVVYNNRYERAQGWIHTSTAYAVKTGSAGETALLQKDLWAGLDLSNNDSDFCIFRDHISGLEYIRNCRGMHDEGLFVELDGYQHHVFLDFRQVRDNEWRHYDGLCEHLNGAGVPNIEVAAKELTFKPLLDTFEEVLNPAMCQQFIVNRTTSENGSIDTGYIHEFDQKYLAFLRQVSRYASGSHDASPVKDEIMRKLLATLQLANIETRFPWPKSLNYQAAIKFLKQHLPRDSNWNLVYAWLLVHDLGKMVDTDRFQEVSRSWIDEWPLGDRIHRQLEASGGPEMEGRILVNILTSYQHWFYDRKPKKMMEARILRKLLSSPEVQHFLKVNRFDDVLWFNKESFQQLVAWLFLVAVVHITSKPDVLPYLVAKEVTEVYAICKKWLMGAAESGYKIERLLEAVVT